MTREEADAVGARWCLYCGEAQSGADYVCHRPACRQLYAAGLANFAADPFERGGPFGRGKDFYYRGLFRGGART